MTTGMRISAVTQCLIWLWLIDGVFLTNPVMSFSPSIQSTVTRMTSWQAHNKQSESSQQHQIQHPWIQLFLPPKTISLPTAVLSTALLLGTVISPPTVVDSMNHRNLFFSSWVPPANAAESKVIGSLKGSGLVFKDTLQIERFDDPKVQGVTLYISNFDRPITEKLSGGNFFNDPSYASVACARTGNTVSIADNIAKGPQGEEVFEESRSLLFKTLRVQRVYDEEKKTVVYVSYNTRLDKNDDSNKSRFKSSLCAVNLE
jgi:catabolite regulation protein CreA